MQFLQVTKAFITKKTLDKEQDKNKGNHLNRVGETKSKSEWF